ncbi:transposase, partial [Enterococcus faecalis]|uniref:transposase n=1 Tax=Enterococcus faecalis TaxID=1351 RepID=UPI003D6B439A
PESLNQKFRKKLQNLLKYEQVIRNQMIYRYSKDKIEAKNTHIKTLKRVSYGYKLFENIKIRIYMINHLIEVK